MQCETMKGSFQQKRLRQILHLYFLREFWYFGLIWNIVTDIEIL